MANKAPIRTCIACGTSSDKRSLARVVRSPEGEVKLDLKGKAAGRGAYVCREAQCLADARKRHLFDKALRVKMSEADYERLEENFRTAGADGTRVQ